MSRIALILGDSGTGKSASIEGLDHRETFIISVAGKDLPFRGAEKKYTKLTKGNPKGNYIVSDSYAIIAAVLGSLETRPEIKNLVIDDFQFLMVNEFMRRHSSAGVGNAVFQLYNDLADHVWNLIRSLQMCRKDLIVFCLSHQERNDEGRTKAKTIGKMLDEKLGTMESLFSIVLNTKVDDGKYFFQTQNNGLSTSKTPKGMFGRMEIENDLGFVAKKIREYYK